MLNISHDCNRTCNNSYSLVLGVLDTNGLGASSERMSTRLQMRVYKPQSQTTEPPIYKHELQIYK